MTELIARFKPGENVPAFAGAQVNAGHFVRVTGAKTEQGDYPVQHSGAGAAALGVAEYDSAPASYPDHATDRRINVVRRGAIARVVAGAAVSVGALVSSDATGRAITHVPPNLTGNAEALPAGPVILGRALTEATLANDVIEVDLF